MRPSRPRRNNGRRRSWVTDDAFFGSRQGQIVGLAARHRLPARYFNGTFVPLGGLISYEDDRSASIRQVGRYAGRILKGATELPVLQSTKFEFLINPQTARALGIEVR